LFGNIYDDKQKIRDKNVEIQATFKIGTRSFRDLDGKENE
jgi:hypothetical protein